MHNADAIIDSLQRSLETEMSRLTESSLPNAPRVSFLVLRCSTFVNRHTQPMTFSKIKSNIKDHKKRVASRRKDASKARELQATLKDEIQLKTHQKYYLERGKNLLEQDEVLQELLLIRSNRIREAGNKSAHLLEDPGWFDRVSRAVYFYIGEHADAVLTLLHAMKVKRPDNISEVFPIVPSVLVRRSESAVKTGPSSRHRHSKKRKQQAETSTTAAFRKRAKLAQTESAPEDEEVAEMLSDNSNVPRKKNKGKGKATSVQRSGGRQ